MQTKPETAAQIAIELVTERLRVELFPSEREKDFIRAAAREALALPEVVKLPVPPLKKKRHPWYAANDATFRKKKK